jgi:glutamate-5-semialdehyde dehydrogenase
VTNSLQLSGEMLALGRSAKGAARTMRDASTETKNKALRAAAATIRSRANEIGAANAKDLSAATSSGLTPALRDRLMLDGKRIEAMAKGIEDVAALPDPVGRELARWTMPNGLDIARIATPIGVIAMIYESRPNVTADAAALALKAGNITILRAGLPDAAISLVPTTDRAAVGLILTGLEGTIDLIIPRGGKGLTSRVMAEARVPVLAHLEGVCHVYVHEKANLATAREIVLNSKMRRTGVCGAAETLLIDRNIVRAAFPAARPAAEDDWSREYLDAIIAVKTVDSVDDAIRHIERHGSNHTESIVTDDSRVAEHFLAALDSAIVLWNASTQFADGAEFGMGAEIGIGTGKLHARGPVGVEQLTTFKYVVRGTGQVRP